MRYLVFSDTHLTTEFDQKKFTVLKDAIEHSDQVIINGDFWEGFTTKFSDFVTSQWARELFPLLKKKKAVYLYGNHDKKEYSNSQTSLFSDIQQDKYILKSGKNTYHVTHGNSYIKLPDLTNWVLYILEYIEDFLYKVFGKYFLLFAYSHFNRSIKNQIRNSFGENEFLVTGHTHFAEVDLEDHFINSGFIKHGLAQYIFIEDGKVTAVEKRY